MWGYGSTKKKHGTEGLSIYFSMLLDTLDTFVEEEVQEEVFFLNLLSSPLYKNVSNDIGMDR